MATVQISFLGRTPGNAREGYRTTVYDYGDGQSEAALAFFGWSLQRRLQPEKLLILGTQGSMWDHLVEGDIDLGDQSQDIRSQLIEASANKMVTQAMVDQISPALSQALGCETRLLIIPYCRTESEQVDVLRILADQVQQEDVVDLDISHGFRHLPMLALLAAFHLRQLRSATIRGVWYGAYDPDSGRAPVHNLVGLLRIADWLQALNTYDKDGDYSVFAPLLAQKSAEYLERAAFFERTTNPVQAREALTTWNQLDRDALRSDHPEAALFYPELERRIQWYRGSDRAHWEASLARQYLSKGDFVRAVIFALESMASRECLKHGQNINDFEQRDDMRRLIMDKDPNFKLLNTLRNAMAHGVRARDKRIKKMISTPEILRAELHTLFEKLKI